MLVTELKQLQLKSETISIERDCDDDILTGLICFASEEITAMHLYTDDGDYDGFTVFETHQIDEVFWDNREHRAITQLIKELEPAKTPYFKNKEFQPLIIELNSKYDSICFLGDEGEDSFDVGKIEKSDEKWIKIRALGNKKTLSPMTRIFLRDSIKRVTVDSPYQNQLVKLHNAELTD